VVGVYLGDEIRQDPQKHDDEQEGDPDDILPPVFYQDTYGIGGIAERVGEPIAERVHLLVIEVAG
jgi:hypothetical protein